MRSQAESELISANNKTVKDLSRRIEESKFRETEASTSRLGSHSNSIEGLKQEIEKANEEQVLVELGRMEAVKEFEAIEAEREAEETKFTSTMEKTRKKIKELMRDIDRTKELEAKLAITKGPHKGTYVLQNELRLEFVHYLVGNNFS
ncbi:hypothetical protein IFM89_000369 [Coptis chinensis]|uniref:Uncharacterized protein n=1 Tax=Coptis chinensis TaxID=261450 RepID=A0A835LQ37_9MAGN|nr:hypothetical protein IFM89_000369 [Coptis chinensis]